MINIKEKIARRVAWELKEGYVVNLGIGLPTLVANYIPDDFDIILQSENGMVRMGPAPAKGMEDVNITNAGGVPVTVLKGGAFFDSALSFAIIRGGHVDLTVLGALQIDETGSLSSHIIPGERVPGMGGAMDLIVGSKKVIVATTHIVTGGGLKILKKCTLPITAVSKVNVIVTELAYIEVTDKGLLLKEIAEDTTIEHVQSLTEPTLIIDENLKTF